MVLGKRARVATPLPEVQALASCALLLAALSSVACSVYETNMVGHGRKRLDGEGDALTPEASGGKSQSAAGSPGADGNMNGGSTGHGGAGGGTENTGSTASATTGGRSGAEGGSQGHAGSANRGGADMTGEGTSGAMGEGKGGTLGDGGNPASGGASAPATGGAPMTGGAGGAGGTSGAGAATGGASGSTSTSGGSGGTGNGKGGATGSGGAMGTGGSATGGSAGKAGSGEVCSGCARLSVPLSSSTDHARFVLSLAGDTDLTDATVTLRIARPRGTGGKIKAYIQEGAPDFNMHFSPAISISSLSTSMASLTFKIGDAVTSADTTAIERVGVEIVGEGSSTFASPIVIYVDRISVTGEWVADQNWTFDTVASVSTTPTSSGPIGKMWLNSYRADTNVSGAGIQWLGP